MTDLYVNSEEPVPQKLIHLNPEIAEKSPIEEEFNQESKTQNFRIKQSAELKKKIENRKSSEMLIKEYPKFKYLDAIYEINSDVFIKNTQKNDDLIGRIKKIILLVMPDNKLQAILLVQWYYRRNDLPDKYQTNEFNFISENEVFETKCEEYIPIQLVNGDCEILTYDDYDKLPNIKDNTIFFKRAWFDCEQQEIIDPPVSQWEKSCICNQPLNPDLHYVQCDKCEKWYHSKCVKLSKEALKSKSFFCQKCQK